VRFWNSISIEVAIQHPAKDRNKTITFNRNEDLNMNETVDVSDYNKWAINIGSVGSTLKSTQIKSKYFSNVPK